MTEEEGFDRIIDNLKNFSKASYTDERFLSTYKSINPLGLDLLMDAAKEQFVAGGYLCAAVMSLACQEPWNSGSRLERFWGPFLSAKSNDIMGLKTQVEQAMQFLHRIMQNKSMLFSVVGDSGSNVAKKQQAVQTWVMIWIAGGFLLDGRSADVTKLSLCFSENFFKFYEQFRMIMDQVYGTYAIPFKNENYSQSTGCVIPIIFIFMAALIGSFCGCR